MEDLVQWELLYISRALLQYLWKYTSDNMKLWQVISGVSYIDFKLKIL